MRTTLLLIGTLSLCALQQPCAADAIAPQPFTATYQVSYRGFGAGTLRMQLLRDPQTGQYIFETRANPSMLARVVVSRNALERSVMEVTGDGVRPLQWQADDGKSGNKGDGALAFDWSQQAVSGEYQGAPVALSTQPKLQDRQSIQIQVMTDLMRGKEPGAVPLISDDTIREYSYTRGTTASLDTKLGKLDTVIYESTRPGSSRVSRVWHAPSLGYVPVRAEQVRKGKVETVMTLISLDRQ